MKKQVVSGILLINKPQDISSHTALSQAKRLLMSPVHDSKKAGHTGTLDPMATGLLPMCFGEATKFSSFGLDADKGYTAIIKLGSQTDTGDAMGQVVNVSAVPSFDQRTLDDVASRLLGEQMQVPPMYSALKKDGKKLYEYARMGVEVDRQARPITIHQLNLTKISDDEIELVVRCSKGTYVRVLGETVAQMLDTLGHLTALHRTQTGGFDVGGAITIDELNRLDFDARFAKLLPIDAMMTHLPQLIISDDETKRIQMGQRLNVKDRIGDVVFDGVNACHVRLYGDGVFVGLGSVEPTGRLQPIRIISRT